MRLSEEFFYTLREDLKDEDSLSGNLLVKSGMFKKVSNGVYMKLPLGFRVCENVKNIVRKYMNEAGATEISMPNLIPLDFYEYAGRVEVFGNSMFKLKDRYSRDYALGPTHEEMFAMASLSKVKSYKDLPYTIYQIGNKYRDEMRPRLGLIRTREFTMKDAYSFDSDIESLDESYKKMFLAYNKIFKEIGLDYIVVKADTGAMGGMLSEEFQAVTDVGEDILVLCDSCDYSSNIEVSSCVSNSIIDDIVELEIEEVCTPNVGGIEDVVNYLKLPVSMFVKTIIYNIDGKYYACMVEADREVNENKVLKLVGGIDIELADVDKVREITGANVGFAGPVGLDIPIIMDENLKFKKNFIVGANKTDYHLKNVNVKDFKPFIVSDIRNIKEGDICPKCGGKIYFKKGIEVGNTFKLGTKYSECMGLNFLDKENKLKPVMMGCYGIGIERIVAAVVEQFHDDKGIIWPMSIAPFKVSIVLINLKDEKQVEVADKLYRDLINLGIDVILDDRDERAGVKFNDMDLIGIPVRITVGKKVQDDVVEVKLRNEVESKDYSLHDVLDVIKGMCF